MIDFLLNVMTAGLCETTYQAKRFQSNKKTLDLVSRH